MTPIQNHPSGIDRPAKRHREARAALHLATAQIDPDLNGQVNFAEQRLSQEGLPADKVDGNPEGSAAVGSVKMGWEIDFWGLYWRAREAARAFTPFACIAHWEGDGSPEPEQH